MFYLVLSAHGLLGQCLSISLLVEDKKSWHGPVRFSLLLPQNFSNVVSYCSCPQHGFSFSVLCAVLDLPEGFLRCFFPLCGTSSSRSSPWPALFSSSFLCWNITFSMTLILKCYFKTCPFKSCKPWSLMFLFPPSLPCASLSLCYCIYTYASPVAQKVKSLPAMQETLVRPLSCNDPWEQEMATHSSILAWRIPWTVEPGGLRPIGLQRVRHDWVTLSL